MHCGERVIIFGLGRRLERLKEEGCLSGMNIVAFCDNDTDKQGSLYDNIEVISPNKIEEYTYDSVYISSRLFENDIRQQLIKECAVPIDRIKCFYAQGEKYNGEIGYWEKMFRLEGGKFLNYHYEQLMLSIAQEKNDDFLQGKIVADFGCGPRGSLAWTNRPSIKLGIDVLASRYLEAFGEELIKHNMIYVTSSEARIPIPDSFVDCLCTINSLDHVDNLEQMIGEILRIMKPGATILASFNLNEPSSKCEPQTLTEEIIKKKVLKYFNIESYRLAYRGEGDVYENLRNGNLIYKLEQDKCAILWIRGTKLKVGEEVLDC